MWTHDQMISKPSWLVLPPGLLSPSLQTLSDSHPKTVFSVPCPAVAPYSLSFLICPVSLSLGSKRVSGHGFGRRNNNDSSHLYSTFQFVLLLTYFLSYPSHERAKNRSRHPPLKWDSRLRTHSRVGVELVKTEQGPNSSGCTRLGLPGPNLHE